MFVTPIRLSYVAALSVAFVCASSNAQQPVAIPNEDKGVEIDFLFGYYDQEGDHSPVTGGVGTEDQQVVSPVFVVHWEINDKWSLNGNLGLDNITSASTDNIDLGVPSAEVSSASRKDNRVFTSADLVRSFGEQRLGLFAGFSKEYDYSSIAVGLSWARDFNQKNTTLSAALRHYMDTIDLYDIDGELQGDDDRETTDVSVSLTQVLSRKTVGTIELSLSSQSGFLSTPFHEVILRPGAGGGAGEVVAERLPDSRERMALGLRVNHAFTPRIVQRAAYRYYDDDFDVSAHTLEFETHFRLPTKREMWLFPIVRLHSQDGSRYFGLPSTFSIGDEFYSADRDLSEFDSEKLGLGIKVGLEGTRAWFAGIRDFEFRVTRYDRDDGLESLNTSFGFSWR